MDRKILILALLSLLLVLFLSALFSVVITKKQYPTPTPTPTTTTRLPQIERLTPAPGSGLEPEWFLQQEREFLQKTPILQSLPKEDLPYFSIGYVSEEHLIVYSKTENKERDYEEAREWFAQNGINTSNIFIEYK